MKIGITDSYRSYDEQVDVARRKGLYSQGGLAAKPGTSEHGWGMATDLDLNSKAQAWMRANGEKYGFVENVPARAVALGVQAEVARSSRLGQISSPCSRDSQPSRVGGPGAPGRRDALQVLLGRGAGGQRLRAMSDLRIRSAHMPPHHARSSGVGEAPRARRGGDVGEAGRVRPGEQPASGVRLAAVGAGHPLVQGQPLVQLRQLREPGEGRVVAVAYRDHAARPGDPAHLAQRGDRVADVLQHLVGVHHVEGVVGEVQRVHVADGEVDVVEPAPVDLGAGQVQRRVGDLQGGHPAGCDYASPGRR